MAKKKKVPTLQEEIVDVCLRRGIIFPAAEIYGGVSGFYDFGPVGEAIRQNLMDLWKESFVNSEDNIFLISGVNVLPEKVFEASGHTESFNDPLTQCDNCKSMYRVDHIIEEQTSIQSEGKSLRKLGQIIRDEGVKCTKCGGNLGAPRHFNMMFETQIGSSEGNKGFLRPETAQNIFLNFRRIAHSMRAKLPFGIAQIGRAYRNEISARNFLVRLRELQQMEIEMFVDPEELDNHPSWEDVEDIRVNFLSIEDQLVGKPAQTISIRDGFEQKLIMNQYLGYYIALENEFIKSLGIAQETFWFRQLQDHERAHYSKANYDLEIQFPFGIVECVGLAYRTDYDLTKHQEKSGTKLHIDQNGKKVIPHVVEPSFGIDRLIYAILLANYQKEGRDWTWFKFPGSIAPWEVLVTPLMKKDGLAEAAKQIYWELKDQGLDTTFDMTGAIGKRYARADEIGIPLIVTYDYDSLKDDTVTLRERDTTNQIRLPIDELSTVIREYILGITNFEELSRDFTKITK